jgi:hypothetical protein
MNGNVDSKKSSLEKQLVGFPKSKLWDLMDGLSYIIQLLEVGERYFVSRDQDLSNPEAEYAELEYEAPVEDWRNI